MTLAGWGGAEGRLARTDNGHHVTHKDEPFKNIENPYQCVHDFLRAGKHQKERNVPFKSAMKCNCVSFSDRPRFTVLAARLSRKIIASDT